MKYLQLIFSPTGGTERTANIITSEWSETVKTVDLSDPTLDFAQCEIQPEDIALIALPSFGGRVPATAAERLLKIRGNAAKCVLLCVYGNRAYEDTLVEMEDIAIKCGFTVIAAISAVAEHSIMHQFAAGRPDVEDAKQLKAFAQAVLEKVKKETPGDGVKIPGNRPYKKAGGAGLVPKATKKCTACGLCAAQCPTQAISPENIRTADPEKCISCMRCVAVCPASAREVNGVMVAAASMAMKKTCSVRKSCEIFI